MAICGATMSKYIIVALLQYNPDLENDEQVDHAVEQDSLEYKILTDLMKSSERWVGDEVLINFCQMEENPQELTSALQQTLGKLYVPELSEFLTSRVGETLICQGSINVRIGSYKHADYGFETFDQFFSTKYTEFGGRLIDTDMQNTTDDGIPEDDCCWILSLLSEDSIRGLSREILHQSVAQAHDILWFLSDDSESMSAEHDEEAHFVDMTQMDNLLKKLPYFWNDRVVQFCGQLADIANLRKV